MGHDSEFLKARSLMRRLYPDDPAAATFTASHGWFRRFIKRFNIKFRKRQNQKKSNIEDHREAIMNWHKQLRYDVLPPRPDTPKDHWDWTWGRFPPERRYNMDQVPLPFVVDQGSSYVESKEQHIQICSTGSAGLTKRQFTAHIFSNAGTGEKGDAWIEMIARGTGKGITALEKAGWNPKVPV